MRQLIAEMDEETLRHLVKWAYYTNGLIALSTADHAQTCPVSFCATSGPCNCSALSREDAARLYWETKNPKIKPPHIAP
jgi:hypothetical protein